MVGRGVGSPPVVVPPTVPPTIPHVVPPVITVKAATTTTLSMSKPAPQMNEPVSLLAHIAVAGGQPVSGTVRFLDNGTEIGSATVNAAGEAKLDQVRLRLGAHKITAVYTPANSQTVAGSISSTIPFTIAKSASTTQLIASPTSATPGAPVTLDAIVTTPHGAPAIGTVTFKNGATVLGTVKLNGNGVARLTLATPGNYNVQAFYSGSSTLEGSQSSAVAIGILTPPPAPAATTIQLVSSTTTVTPGQPINLQTTVMSGGKPVTSGQVRYYNGSKLVGTINVGTNGQANLSTKTSALGAREFRAVFVGTATAATTSSTLTVTVVKPATVVSFAVPTAPINDGKPRTVAVKVAAPGGGSPIGSVTLKVNGTALGTFPVDGRGLAKVIFSHGYVAGLGNLKFEYSGSSMFAGSSLDVAV